VAVIAASSEPDYSVVFGLAAIAAGGDWNQDGNYSAAICRPSNGIFYLTNRNTSRPNHNGSSGMRRLDSACGRHYPMAREELVFRIGCARFRPRSRHENPGMVPGDQLANIIVPQGIEK